MKREGAEAGRKAKRLEGRGRALSEERSAAYAEAAFCTVRMEYLFYMRLYAPFIPAAHIARLRRCVTFPFKPFQRIFGTLIQYKQACRAI